MIVEDTYFEVKNAIASSAPGGPQTLVFKLMYLQAKQGLKSKFVKMLRIFYIEIDIL